MAMGNTTVDPRNTAVACGSVIEIASENEKLKSGENGPLFVAQGENLELTASSNEGFKIYDGEIVGPDGNKTGAKISKEEEENYKNYRAKIEEVEKNGMDR